MQGKRRYSQKPQNTTWYYWKLQSQGSQDRKWCNGIELKIKGKKEIADKDKRNSWKWLSTSLKRQTDSYTWTTWLSLETEDKEGKVRI